MAKKTKKAKKKVAARVAKKPAAKKASAVPPGFRTVTPHLIVKGAADVIEFWKKAFGAKLRYTMPGPGGSVVHGEMQVGDSIIMFSDEMPMEAPGGKSASPKSLGGTTGGVFLYVKDVDKLFNQAVAAGATVRMPPTDMFWGDRFGQVVDTAGHIWAMATHVEDVPDKEMRRRQEDFMKQMSQGGAQH